MVGLTERDLLDDESLDNAIELAGRLVANVERVVHGKPEEIRLVVATLISGGHVLLEDMPGTAKTVLSRALARSIGDASFSRIQCTPDLQPTDVTGLSIFDPRSREFAFHAGPVFANVLLVDEINRAMPKTQSALLEAMAEKQVTIEGTTRTLPEPFLVLATENPIEQEGTFPLPEAQLDRFAVKTSLGYPGLDDEVRIVEEQRAANPLDLLEPAITMDELLELRRSAQEVYIDGLLVRWLVELVRATRSLDEVSVGASVRANLALERLARAWALVQGRTYVEPSDVERLFRPVVAHRLVIDPLTIAEDEARHDRTLLDRIWAECVARAPAPSPDWDTERS
ncbi:MAG TPA: AAA family ATPase [Gaiellaceae bacterium]|jgi:MoxR-like ATPase|nr:AAA family ATPase [Gaiellaceae bacterium]